MALKEYDVDGRTYLFDEKDVPKGATLVSDKPANTTTIEENVATETPEEKAAREAAEAEDIARKAAEAKANKQAKTPENKQVG